MAIGLFAINDILEWDHKPSSTTQELSDGPLIVREIIDVPDTICRPSWGFAGGPLRGFVGHAQWLIVTDSQGKVITDHKGEPCKFSGSYFRKKEVAIDERVVPCRFGDSSPAVGRYLTPQGCVCYPHDREQDLCAQHVLKDGMIGDARLILIYQPWFYDAWDRLTG